MLVFFLRISMNQCVDIILLATVIAICILSIISMTMVILFLSHNLLLTAIIIILILFCNSIGYRCIQDIFYHNQKYKRYNSRMRSDF